MYLRVIQVLGIFFIAFLSPAHSQQVNVKRDTTGFNFFIGKQLVLHYQSSNAPVPENVDAVFSKSGFIHPLITLGGQKLTRIQPADHYHHYGIWSAWTNTTISGDSVDFWNLADRKGRVEFDRIISYSKGQEGTLRVGQNHLKLKNADSIRVAIQEELEIKVKPLTDFRYQVDYFSDFFTELPEGILLNAYRYGGGIAFRATEIWGEMNSSILTSEGKERDSADGLGIRWVIIQGFNQEQDAKFGLLILSHITNFGHPEPLRIWPSGEYEGFGNVFINLTPTRNQSWQLKPGNIYHLKYRLIVFDGELNEVEAEEYWQNFISN